MANLNTCDWPVPHMAHVGIPGFQSQEEIDVIRNKAAEDYL